MNKNVLTKLENDLLLKMNKDTRIAFTEYVNALIAMEQLVVDRQFEPHLIYRSQGAIRKLQSLLTLFED